MDIVTHKTPDAAGWAIDDPVIRLRQLGTEVSYDLPQDGTALTIGAAAECDVRLDDPTGCVSRQHARVSREAQTWTISDLGSRNGIRHDGELRLSFELVPGVLVELGGVSLIAESARLVELRRFLARIIGWSATRATEVDRALRALRDAATRRAVLILCGAGELASIARRLHVLSLGATRPFEIATDSAMSALERIGAGTLCVSTDGLPSDFAIVAKALQDSRNQARLTVCAPTRADAGDVMALLERAAAIELPALAARADELDRLLLEFAEDARIELGAPRHGFREHELHWLREVPLATLAEIEELALRVVALRAYGVAGGAKRLGISHVALSRWARRRNIPT